VFQVTRKIIRRFISPDGTEKEEITLQGTPQEPLTIEDGDGYSKVIKRVILKSDTEQSEVRPPNSPSLPEQGRANSSKKLKRFCVHLGFASPCT
jgi:hypothetical protein